MEMYMECTWRGCCNSHYFTAVRRRLGDEVTKRIARSKQHIRPCQSLVSSAELLEHREVSRFLVEAS
eukprot:746187-Hanusia_phi.AAC.3